MRSDGGSPPRLRRVGMPFASKPVKGCREYLRCVLLAQCSLHPFNKAAAHPRPPRLHHPHYSVVLHGPPSYQAAQTAAHAHVAPDSAAAAAHNDAGAHGHGAAPAAAAGHAATQTHAEPDTDSQRSVLGQHCTKMGTEVMRMLRIVGGTWDSCCCPLSVGRCRGGIVAVSLYFGLLMLVGELWVFAVAGWGGRAGRGLWVDVSIVVNHAR